MSRTAWSPSKAFVFRTVHTYLPCLFAIFITAFQGLADINNGSNFMFVVLTYPREK